MKSLFVGLMLFTVGAYAAEKTSTLRVDAAKSKITWVGKKVTGQHDGTVALKSGVIELKNQKLVGGTVVVDMTTIKNLDIEDPEYKKKLETHLNSDDFFSTAKFAESKLVIKSAKETGKNKFEVQGDLTIKGKTLPTQFPIEVIFQDKGATAKGGLKIDRTKYDIKYNSGKFFPNIGDKLIYDDFELNFEVTAIE